MDCSRASIGYHACGHSLIEHPNGYDIAVTCIGRCKLTIYILPQSKHVATTSPNNFKFVQS